MKHIKTYNESIRQYLKPKSKEQILKGLEGLSIEKQFEKACEFGITWVVKELLDKDFHPTYNFDIGIILAITYGHKEIVEILLKDKRIDPSINDNIFIRIACENGHKEIVELLLKDKRVYPVIECIIDAYEYGHKNIIKLLLDDKRVSHKLTKTELELYQNYINNLNESILHYLKPKSKEQILKGINDMSSDEQFIKACQFGLTWLVQDLINKKYNPSNSNNTGIRLASFYGHKEVVELLLSDRRVNPSDKENLSIRWASINGHKDIVELLLKDRRVRNSLTKRQIEKFQKQIQK